MSTVILTASAELPMPNFMLDPGHFDLVRVGGADAARFLQGQVTCDVEAASPGHFIYGAACNNKGRVITPFMLCREEQDFLLVFRRGLAALFLNALRKFLPFYKCSMAMEEQAACLGLGGNDLTDWLRNRGQPVPEPGNAVAVPGGWIARMTGTHPQILACGDRAAIAALAAAAGTMAVRDDGALWQATCLRNGHFPFDAADSEQYTPQELHYEQQQYVSFSKGCYTGQEIVARMHYRGKIKKQFRRVELATPASAAPERIELLGADGSIVAECTKATHLPQGGTVALALLPVDFVAPAAGIATTTGHTATLHPF